MKQKLIELFKSGRAVTVHSEVLAADVIAIIVEWGETPCRKHIDAFQFKQRECPECWQELKDKERK